MSDEEERFRQAARRLGAARIADVPEAIGEAELGMQRLEEIFGGAAGLEELRKRSPEHPALAQLAGLRRVVEAAGIGTWPNEIGDFELYSEVLIDSMSWAPAPPYKDVFAELDENTRGWVVPSLRDPNRYEDVMAELYFWGRLRHGGHSCGLVEDEGMPDLVICQSGDPRHLEVKRIHVGTKPTRIAEVAKDANRKFKRADPDGAGTLLVSISREPGRARLDERVPNDVAPYVEAARLALHPGQLRSVGEILISWDDFLTLGAFPDSVLHSFFRRAVRIEHPEPRSRPLLLEEDSVGVTVVSGVRWPDTDGWQAPSTPATPARRFGEMVVTELFRQTSELHEGIRPGHAMEVMREPDCIVGRKLEGLGEIYLATRRSELMGGSVLLVFAGRRSAAEIEVQAAFRLADDGNLPAEIEFDPNAAFQLVLERFGREVRIGDRSGRLIERLRAPASAAVSWGGRGSVILYAMGRRDSDSVDYGWVFAIDVDRYRSFLRADPPTYSAPDRLH